MMRFAAIGLDHGHINGQVSDLRAAGAELAGYATPDDVQAAAFEAEHAGAVRFDAEALLADPSIGIVASAAIASDRAGIAVRAMEAGKDVLLDKPGAVSREGLAAMQDAHQRTRRKVQVYYSELERNAASLTALRLVRDGAIGKVIHYSGTGPHRLDQGKPRPDWFFDACKAGGILCDIASHQIAQCLAFAGVERGRILSGRAGSRGAHPGFQDIGDFTMEAGETHGYARVDWFTPKGMPVWGDGRIILTGSEGVIELRKYVDPAGEGPGAHLILTDKDGPRRIPCDATSSFCARFIDDRETGGETAMAQKTAFHIMDLALTAQEMADAA